MDSDILLATIIIMGVIAVIANSVYADRGYWKKYYQQQASDNFDFAMRIIDSIRD